MENNKDIGKAFREKLDQLDKMPSDQLWSSIEKDLPTNRRRKMPLFWIFSSVAITGLVMSGLFFWNQSTIDVPSNPKITLDTNHNSAEQLNKNIENPASNSTITNQTATSKTLSTNNSAVEHFNNNIENPESNNITTNQTVAGKTNKKALATVKHVDEIYKVASDSAKKSSPKTKIAANQKGQNTTTSKSKEIELKRTKLKSQLNSNSTKVLSSSGISKSNPKQNITRSHKKTVNTSETEKLVNNTKRLVKSTEEYDEYEVVKKYTYIVRKKKVVESEKGPVNSKKVIPNKNKKSSDKKRPVTKKIMPKKSPKDMKNVQLETIQPPIQNTTEENQDQSDLKTKEEPKTKEESKTKVDSLVVTVVEKKPEFIAKKAVKKVKDSVPTVQPKKHTIIVTPFFGPTYYNSFGKGHSVSGNYRNDPKKGLIGTTYGAYIRWMFTDRIGLRTGIGKTKLSYETSIQKKDTLFLDTRNIILDPNLSTFDIEKQFANDPKVVLRQNLEYYEIPLEGYYDFTGKKIGLAMAFGVSYLFLDKNSLTLKSNTVPEYTIGKASNLVDQSFTGNAKLIAYYKLTKSLSFDVMPSFQYQIIAFKEDVGAFKPYFLSLKAGLSYRF